MSPLLAGCTSGVSRRGERRYNRTAVLRLWLLILVAAASPAQALYEVSGRISPEGPASVTLFGATHPFTASTFTDENGRFHFKKLVPASYTVAVFQPGRGEARQTIEVGPSLADSRNRIRVTLTLKDDDFDTTSDRRRHSVTTQELAIPERALRDFADSQHDLEKSDVEAAENTWSTLWNWRRSSPLPGTR